jgi:predicted enzyme related to lactoylglutathione lyase
MLLAVPMGRTYNEARELAVVEDANQNTGTSDSGVGAGLARHGGLSYLEIPAVDARRSAAFYQQVLDWRLRGDESDDPRFEDSTGHLIGRWVTGRAIAGEPGLLAYFYVDRIDDVVRRVVVSGGEVVESPYAEGNLWVATIRDPPGNVFGLWQEGPR